MPTHTQARGIVNGWAFPWPASRLAAARLLAALVLCMLGFWPTSHVAVRTLGWVGIAALALADLRVSVVLVCFFAAFFKNYGALEIGWFLRPLHVVSLCLLVRLARDMGESRLERELAKTLAWCCAPLLLIAVLAYLAGATHSDASYAIKGVVKLCFGIVLLAALSFALRDRENRRWAVGGFLAGAALKAWLMLGTLGQATGVFGESLRLNHSLAILSGASSVLAFAGLSARRSWIALLLRFGGVLLLTSAVALSLSRSAWVGSLVGWGAAAGVLFLGLNGKASGQRRFVTWALLCVGVGWALALWGMHVDEDFRARILGLHGLLQPAALHNTFFVDEGGGFLGERVRQFSQAMDILRKNPVLGIGFSQTVVGFRSLYLTVLAGSGIVGFLAFLLFALLYLQLLYDAARRQEERAVALAAMGIEGAVVAWLVSSLAENLLFEPWAWVLMALGVGCVFAAFQARELWQLVRHRFRIWCLRLTLAAVVLLVLDPGMRWSWRLSGWLAFGVLALVDPNIGLQSLFFLSPFFVHYGVFEVPLAGSPFHVKPLHVAYGLTAVALALRRGTFLPTWRGGRLFVPLLFFSALAVASACWSPEPLKALRSSLNLIALAVMFGTAFAWIRDWGLFRRCLELFLGGVLLRLVVVLANELLGTSFFDELLPHNHHVALLAVTASGLAAALLASERLSYWRRAFYGFVLLISSIAVLLSLARAAWLAASFGFCTFYAGAIVYARRRRSPLGPFVWFPVGLALLALAVRLFYWTPEVASRVRSILSLADIDFLIDCVRDRARGGHVFGVRLRQILDFWGVFRGHWLLGTGFTVRSLGYHGLAYTVLASCGVAGAALAGWFAWRWVRSVAGAVRRAGTVPKGILGLGLLACFVSWALYSLSETLFLQFDVWVLLTSGAVYAKLVLLERSSARSQERS